MLKDLPSTDWQSQPITTWPSLRRRVIPYHAIAFLVPHSELLPQKPTADDFQVYAVSIDKLEQETGIDFFCNLPDVIEDEVEKAYNKADWAW